MTQEFIEKVADAVSREGIEYWDRVCVADLVSSEHVCLHCGPTTWRKETDILDVWFDSGVSHTVVLMHNKELSYPASLYLEGVDQHRGWFQSSLLTAIGLHNSAPYKLCIPTDLPWMKKARK